MTMTDTSTPHPEDPPAYTQAVHDAIAPIRHLEDDSMLCAGFAIAIEHRIERHLADMAVDERRNLVVKYCKVCDETFRWAAVLSPWYESAHRYRRHPDSVCTFVSLGRVQGASS
jgi:hypothetical protein